MFVRPGQGYFFNENYTEVKHLTWSRDKIVPKTSYKVTLMKMYNKTSFFFLGITVLL